MIDVSYLRLEIFKGNIVLILKTEEIQIVEGI